MKRDIISSKFEIVELDTSFELSIYGGQTFEILTERVMATANNDPNSPHPWEDDCYNEKDAADGKVIG